MSKKKKTNYELMRDIDVSNQIEKKGKFNYLSWAWAVDQMYLVDPDASYGFTEPTHFKDGTMMVYCNVTIFGKEKTMWLPVLDYKNKPITNPNAFDVNTAMMRCLVKAIAMHGLGLYIFAGEDIPEATKEEIENKKINDVQIQTLIKLVVEVDQDLDKFCNYYKIERLEDLPSNVFSQAKSGLEKKKAKNENSQSETK